MRRVGALLLILGTALGSPAIAGDLRVQDESYGTLGYRVEQEHGWKFQDASYRTIAYAAHQGDDWELRDASYQTLGHIRHLNDDWKIEDASYQTLGYVSMDGDGWLRVQNAAYQTVGFVDRDGRATDEEFTTLGYLGAGDPIFAGAYFLILRARLPH